MSFENDTACPDCGVALFQKSIQFQWSSQFPLKQDHETLPVSEVENFLQLDFGVWSHLSTHLRKIKMEDLIPVCEGDICPTVEPALSVNLFEKKSAAVPEWLENSLQFSGWLRAMQ